MAQIGMAVKCIRTIQYKLLTLIILGQERDGRSPRPFSRDRSMQFF